MLFSCSDKSALPLSKLSTLVDVGEYVSLGNVFKKEAVY